MLRPYAQKFEAIYEDIRNQVYAHKQINTDVKQLFAKTRVADFEDILFGLWDIMQVLLEIFDNGIHPDQRNGKYDYKEEITKSTHNVLNSLA